MRKQTSKAARSGNGEKGVTLSRKVQAMSDVHDLLKSWPERDRRAIVAAAFALFGDYRATLAFS